MGAAMSETLASAYERSWLYNRDADVPKLRKYVEWVEWQDSLPDGDPQKEWMQSAWTVRLDKIRKDFAPEEWSVLVGANRFTCGTTYCIAGRIAADEGWKPHGRHVVSMVERDGDVAAIRVVAAEALGITQAQADRLFYCNNDTAKVRDIAEKIAGERL